MSQAADTARAERIEAIIAQQGTPYVFHGVNPRIGSWDKQARMEASRPIELAILEHGILPNLSRSMGTPCPTPPWEAAGKTEAEWDENEAEAWWMDVQTEWVLTPRPGHVYFTFDEHAAYGTPTFRIDLRRLDPALVYGDEDRLRDGGLAIEPGSTRDGDPRLTTFGSMHEGGRAWMPNDGGRLWMPDEGSQALTMGEQAEAIGWGENADEILLYENHSLSYRGAIAPHLLELWRDWQGEQVRAAA